MGQERRKRDNGTEEFEVGPYVMRERLPMVVKKIGEGVPSEKQRFSPKKAVRMLHRERSMSPTDKDTDKLLSELEEILKEKK